MWLANIKGATLAWLLLISSVKVRQPCHVNAMHPSGYKIVDAEGKMTISNLFP